MFFFAESTNISEQSEPSVDDIRVSDLNVVVNEMENEAKRLAHSVDTLTENLTGILHSVILYCIRSILLY
jgi:hypothetical protein